jgi:threonine dehydrogenase-like Zn-dependent dehydrogenase
MLCRVVEAGPSVQRVRKGDLAVMTVRRGCGRCLSCAMQRPDMCSTGLYRERGIWGLDGFQTERVTDHEDYIVRVPGELGLTAVLAEPTSVIEKAIHEAVRVQMARLPGAPAHLDWLYGRRCLVAGLGPVGLLSSMVLRLHGAEVYGLDIVDEATSRPQWLEKIGGHYLDGRKIPADKIVSATGGFMELIVDCAGVPRLIFDLLTVLAPSGIYSLAGIPHSTHPLQIQAAELLSRMVLSNQVMLGSVNAARDHFQMAVDDLLHARLQWGDHIDKLITHQYGVEEFQTAFTTHPADEIKAIVQWQAV